MNEALIDALNVIDAETPADLPFMRAKARGLMVGYHIRWQRQAYVPLSVEEVLTADLYNPESGARSRTFTIAGKLDVRAELNGRAVLIDHKTTSSDIADPNGAYWRQLTVESQLSHYMLLEWLNGRKAENAMWDVIRKPQIAPRIITKAELKQIVFEKTWFGAPLSAEAIEQVTATGRETNELYEYRLIHDCSIERPEHYFQRRSIPRLNSEMLEYAQDLWDEAQNLIVARRTNRHPKHSGSCMLYGSPCAFLGVCSGHDDIESENWKKRPWVHPELPVIETRGELLTNSRIRTFQTCPRKHKFSYELAIERVESEDRDALIFGDLIHKALAAWWSYFIPKGESHEHSNSVSANSVESAA